MANTSICATIDDEIAELLIAQAMEEYDEAWTILAWLDTVDVNNPPPNMNESQKRAIESLRAMETKINV